MNNGINKFIEALALFESTSNVFNQYFYEVSVNFTRLRQKASSPDFVPLR